MVEERGRGSVWGIRWVVGAGLGGGSEGGSEVGVVGGELGVKRGDWVLGENVFVGASLRLRMARWWKGDMVVVVSGD